MTGKRDGLDEYEARYMDEGARPLYRERLLPPGWYHALFAIPGAVLAAAPLASGAPWWASLPGLAVLASSWLLLSVLRVAVSSQAVLVQLGPFGPRVPVSSIESVETVRVRALVHGWGIHRLLDGTWCYTLPSSGGQGVKIVWRDEKGRKRKVIVSSERPDLLVDAVERARRGAAVDPHSALEEARRAAGLVQGRAGPAALEQAAVVEEVEARRR